MFFFLWAKLETRLEFQARESRPARHYALRSSVEQFILAGLFLVGFLELGKQIVVDIKLRQFAFVPLSGFRHQSFRAN
jgi:hypothetical protein